MMTIQDLSKRFSRPGTFLSRAPEGVQALDRVSFEIQRHETLALVGGSGCGKSTLARIVSGLYPPDSGRVLWEGDDLLSMPRRERARRVGMIFQDPYASLNPKLTVGHQLSEVAGGREAQWLESVGLSTDALHHYPFQFSGGQRQRIAIARAIALEPRLLIMDEPLSALDVTVQAQILDLFRDLKSRLGLTLLFITHDLALAASFAERVCVMEAGRIVDTGPARETLSNPRHPCTKSLAEAVLVMRA